MNHDFPTIEEIVAIHDAAVREFGGSLGLRDMGALASAVMRPQIGYYDTLIEEAAALMESLAMNHPFIDGNKRTAFYVPPTPSCAGTAASSTATTTRAHRFFMRLFETNSFRFAELRVWLEEHVKPLSGT